MLSNGLAFALASAKSLAVALSQTPAISPIYDVAPDEPEVLVLFAGIGIFFLGLIISIVIAIVTLAVVLIRRSIRKNKNRGGSI